MNTHIYWYTSRATGIVGYALLAASLAWGISHSIRLFKQPRPPWMLDMHRFLSGLACIFVGIHVFVLLFDKFAHYTVLDLLVPFSGQSSLAAKSPIPMALGIVSLYLLLAVEFTSLAMKKLPRKLWKGIHYLSYALFAFVTIHVLMMGTDTNTVAMQWFVLGCCAVNVFLVIVRIASPKRDQQPGRAPSAV
jgi:DMSO/TMAO reductase YedYZ heme-binding membrane subunit